MLQLLLAALETDADKAKFLEIYEKCHGPAEKTAMRMLGNQHDAEDAIQNAFAQVIKHFDKTWKIPEAELQFWVICIVKNEALMIMRRKKRIVELEDWDGIVESAEQISEYGDIVRLFSRLPTTYRAALEMKFLLGYSGAEIAQRLGISEGTVNVRISRGRARLKTLLEKEGFVCD